MSSGIVYSDPEMFAGWPANHGAWQWGHEWLVGFLRGRYAKHSDMHNISKPYEYCFARSMDEGRTWTVEPHGQEFDAGVVFEAAPPFDMQTSIRRVCGVYDHGGDNTDHQGGFFLSNTRGRTWSGPYLFTGLEELLDGNVMENTSRQCELPNRRLMFLSRAWRFHWGTDSVFVAEHDGEKFSVFGSIDFGEGRAVMPAVAEGSDRIVVCVRRRAVGKRHGWIDSSISDNGPNGGHVWSAPTPVGETGGSNGNPPALIEHDGTFYCAFANRSEQALQVSTSKNGAVWSPPLTVAHGRNHDMGYPRMFKRDDGTIVVVYYVASKDVRQQHIAWVEL